jgi:hypothetical protein
MHLHRSLGWWWWVSVALGLSLLATGEAFDFAVCSDHECFEASPHFIRTGQWANVLAPLASSTRTGGTNSNAVQYDFVIDCQSIGELLHTKHWPIEVRDWRTSAPLLRDGYTGALTVVTGLYNKGKTWFLSRLSNVPLPQGVAVNTRGISIKAPSILAKHNMQIVLVDTEGRHAPVTMTANTHTDKIAGDMLSYSVLNDLADYHIVVVNDMTYPDQLLMANILQSRADKPVKEIVVVHNWRAQHRSSVQQLFKRYVESSYPGGVLDRIGAATPAGPFVYTSSGMRDPQRRTLLSQSSMVHVFLVNDDAPDDRAWNDAVFDYVRQLLQYKIARTISADTKWPLFQVLHSLNHHLPMYLDCSCARPLYLHVEQRTRRLSIALNTTCQSTCKHLRPLPLPEVYPIPHNNDVIVPDTARAKQPDGSYVLEIEVPGLAPSADLLQSIDIAPNSTILLQIRSRSDATPSAPVVCIEFISGNPTFVVSGIKPPSKLITNAAARPNGLWRAVATLPKGFLNFAASQVYSCNGLLTLYIPGYSRNALQNAPCSPITSDPHPTPHRAPHPAPHPTPHPTPHATPHAAQQELHPWALWVATCLHPWALWVATCLWELVRDPLQALTCVASLGVLCN